MFTALFVKKDNKSTVFVNDKKDTGQNKMSLLGNDGIELINQVEWSAVSGGPQEGNGPRTVVPPSP